MHFNTKSARTKDVGSAHRLRISMFVEGRGDVPCEVALIDLGRVLNISARRVSQLVDDGVIPKNGRGNYPFAEAVQAYIDWRAKSAERQNASTAADKLRNQRARDLAIRTAQREAELIPLAEAVTETRLLANFFLESISGLPTHITNNPRERQRIGEICEAERLRISHRFARRIRALETGEGPDDVDDEADD